jgi:hypothetical protein
VNILLVFCTVVGFFIIVQGSAAWVRELVHRFLELLPSLLPHPFGDPLAIEIDPLCGDVTFTSHFNNLTTITFYQVSLKLQPNIAARAQSPLHRSGLISPL